MQCLCFCFCFDWWHLMTKLAYIAPAMRFPISTANDFEMFLLVLRLHFRVTLDSVTSQSTCMCIIIQLLYSQYQILDFLATWFKPWPFYPRKFGCHLASQPLKGSQFHHPKKGQRIAGGMFSQHLVLGFLRVPGCSRGGCNWGNFKDSVWGTLGNLREHIGESPPPHGFISQRC